MRGHRTAEDISRAVAFELDPAPLIALMALGFAVGAAGHLIRSKTLIVVGIGLIFLATFVLPLITNALNDR
jgi:hypothetical protein